METFNIDNETKKLRLEYQLFELNEAEKAMVNDSDDVLVYLVNALCESSDKKDELFRQETGNEKKRIVSKVVKNAGKAFGLKSSDFYDADSEFIAWQLRILDGYQHILKTSFDVISDSNYEELYKLCRYAHTKCFRNIESVAELREINLLSSEGTQKERTLPNEDSLFCEIVLNQELDNIINSKNKTYTKANN